DGVVDRTRPHLVETEEPGQDGESGGVGRRPGVGAETVGPEVEDGARPGGRPAARVPRVVQLVEDASVAVDHERVTVASRVLAALDGRVGAEGIRAGVALV